MSPRNEQETSGESGQRISNREKTDLALTAMVRHPDIFKKQEVLEIIEKQIAETSVLPKFLEVVNAMEDVLLKRADELALSNEKYEGMRIVLDCMTGHELRYFLKAREVKANKELLLVAHAEMARRNREVREIYEQEAAGVITHQSLE